MKKKIRISMALVLGLGLLICTVAAAFVFEARFTSRAKEDMQRLVSSVALSAQSTGRDRRGGKAAVGLDRRAAGHFVDEDGVVTGDSAADPATMENHADREEIVTARVAKYGVSVRRSETTGSNMLYVAHPAVRRQLSAGVGAVPVGAGGVCQLSARDAGRRGGGLPDRAGAGGPVCPQHLRPDRGALLRAQVGAGGHGAAGPRPLSLR